MAAVAAILDIEMDDFSNSESLCFNASHQVLAQSDLVLEEMSFEECQDGHQGGHLGCRNGTILAILNHYIVCRSDASH